MSPEVRDILHEWIERSVYEVSAAHGQTASWYGFTHRDRDATNGDYILELIGKIEVVVEECGCCLDQVHGVAVRVPVETAEFGKRELTYRETLATVKAQVLAAMAEAKALADLRAAKATLADLRAKKKAVSVHATSTDVRTDRSVQPASEGVRTGKSAP